MEGEKIKFWGEKANFMSQEFIEQIFDEKREFKISIEQFNQLADFITQIESGTEPYHSDYPQLYKLAIKSECKRIVDYLESDSFKFHSIEFWKVALKFKRVNLLKKSKILLELVEDEEAINKRAWGSFWPLNEYQTLNKEFINYLDSDRTVLASKWLSCQGLNNSWGDETYFMFKACSDFDDQNEIHRKFIKDVCWTNIDFNIRRLDKVHERLLKMKEEGNSVDRLVRKVEYYLQYEFGYPSGNSDSD
nr:hypothetical protein pmam_507 [Pithovirus mammoth]